MALEEIFWYINKNHKKVIVNHVATVCFTGSTSRVFSKAKNKRMKSASEKIKDVLKEIKVNELLKRNNQEKFKKWFEKQLNVVANVIPKKTSKGKKLNEDARKWGYGAKILCLFLREMVLHCRYFKREKAEKIQQWLYCPIDSRIMKKLKECTDVPNQDIDFNRIMDINKKRFYKVQELLGKAASKQNVPRIWFDYIWSQPEFNDLEN